MPRFKVEWEWRVEWLVEAESAEALEAAAKDHESEVRKDIFPGDADVTVYGRAPSSDDVGDVDAVLLDGELLHPDDLAAVAERRRLMQAERDREVAAFEARTGLLFAQETGQEDADER